MVNEKEVDEILKVSEVISKRLNKALLDECAGKTLDLVAAYYSVARFVAGFIDDIRPVYGDSILDSFNSTVKGILQAFEDEGRDDTGRILKWHPQLSGKDENN